MATERIFEGRHLEDALAAAAEATGVPAADLHYRIVEQGRRGLFGLGARSVRIRVEDASPVGLEPPAPPLRAPPPRARPPRQEPRAPRAMAQQPEPNATSRAAAADTLQRMIDLMGLDVQVRAEPSENGLDVVLSGGDRAALAQNDAELRSALQFLINRMARRSWPDVGRIQLTLEGGREGRDAEFIERIRGVAAQVARTGTPHRLPPMNAYERRIVHLTVREFTELGSRSDGNGHLKRVSIFKQGGS